MTVDKSKEALERAILQFTNTILVLTALRTRDKK